MIQVYYNATLVAEVMIDDLETTLRTNQLKKKRLMDERRAYPTALFLSSVSRFLMQLVRLAYQNKNLATLMSDKEAVMELLKRLPAEVSLREILRKIEFIAAVKEGLEEIDQEKGVSVEAVEKMMET